jgi:hypothetical protein
MKIAGRIIQDRNIFENDSKTFFAKYKGHEIHSSIFIRNDKANDEFSYMIVKIQNGNNKNVCSGILQACNIRDVIIHALNEADLR